MKYCVKNYISNKYIRLVRRMSCECINLNMDLEFALNKEKEETLLGLSVMDKNNGVKKVLKEIPKKEYIIINENLKMTCREFLKCHSDVLKIMLKSTDMNEEQDEKVIINLDNKEIIKVLDFLQKSKFNLIINGNSYLNKNIINKNLDLKFKVSVKEDKVKLTQNSFVPQYSTSDFQYFLLNDNIYKPDTMQSFRYGTFYKSFNTLKKNTLTFKNNDLEKTIKLISFKLKEVSSSFYVEKEKEEKKADPLKVDIYIDSNVNEVILKPTFTYGDIVIDLCGEDKFTQSKKVNKRDLDKENLIMNILKKYKFDSRKIGFILDDKEDIIEFILNGVDDLKKIATIHNSENFENKKVYQKENYTPNMNVYNEYIEFSLGIEDVTFEDVNHIFDAIENEENVITMKNGSYMYLNNEELLKIYENLGSRKFTSNKIEKGKFTVSRMVSVFVKGGTGAKSSGRWRKTANDIALSEANNKLYLEKKEKLKEFILKIDSVEEEFNIPKNLDNVMRNYQKIGYKWLKTLAVRNLGGILADEMGLGKTLQAICLILDYVESVEKNENKLPCIVVAPTSLVYNWENEILKFAPELKTCVVYGLIKDRKELLKGLNEHDVVITSYNTLAKDIDSYKDVRFQYAFIDEGQQIKNSNTLNAKAVKLINSNSRFALTGTPIENSLAELWSIFDYIMPGYLLSKARFHRCFQYPIEKFGDENALSTLNEIIKPFILRRMKNDVLLELPEKIEQQIIIDMPDKQKRAYDACLKDARTSVKNGIEDKGFQRSQIHIFSLLTKLRQVCCDPRVVLDDYEGANGKLEMLKDIVNDSIRNGSKILVFSQFVSILENIKLELEKEGINPLILTGKTRGSDRINLVEEFNNGTKEVFLISLKAGGYGLNLTGADVVVHFDPWWNPSVENQATDRAHRIGQKKTVKVYKLITKGTIEERIIKLHESKRNLIDNILSDKNSESNFISSLSQKEVEHLFS